MTTRVIMFGLVFAAGSVYICSAAPPANDDFADRIVLPGVSGSVTGNNAEATLEPGEPCHAYPRHVYDSNSIWYTWTAPSTATFSFDTRDSALGPVLCIYAGGSVGDLTKKVEVPGISSFSASGYISSIYLTH